MPDDESKTDSPLLKKKETSGEYLFRVLKPAGCILVLILFLLYFLVCFTAKPPAASEESAPAPTAQTAEN